MADEKSPAPALNAKQERFCEEYAVDLNGTQAAIRAGYSPKTAEQQACRLLRDARVQARIAELKAAQSQRLEITADQVLGNIMEISERCMQRAPVMVRRGRQMVQLVDEEGRNVWRFDSMGALKANELLGKHIKLFTERHEHSGPDGKPIQLQPVSSLSKEELQARIDAHLARRGIKA